MNEFAVVFVLFCVLHSARASEAEHFVESKAAAKQLYLGRGRDFSAIEVDDLGALVADNKMTNKGTCTMDDRLVEGFGRTGDIFRWTITPDAATCVLDCAKVVKDCVAIEYRNSDKYCYFVVDPGSIYPYKGVTTALVKPTVDSVCDSANMILGYNRKGGDLPGSPHSTKSATECCLLCYTTPKCISYAYVPSNDHCWLKEVVPPLTEDVYVTTGIVCVD